MSEPAAVVSAEWRVLIVEDDPDVALMHRRLVDATSGFETVDVSAEGEAAFQAARQLEPDLAIVDLSMPGVDGLGFLQRVRGEGLAVDAIVVTASRDAATVREVSRLGVVDYLVKPFAPARLQQSLEAFAQRQRVLRRPQLAQEDVDIVHASGATRLRRLPKGLKRSTLAGVRQVLEAADRALTADEVGREIGVARVTARRYLEYLEVIGAAEIERECKGPGRPRNRYRLAARTGDRGKERLHG